MVGKNLKSFKKSYTVAKENGVMKGLFFFSGLFSIISVAIIFIFIAARGLSLFDVVDPFSFLFSTLWEPTADVPSYGILTFILGSIYVTVVALILAVPMGVGIGIVISESELDPKLMKILHYSLEALAGIPSVLFGLFGYTIISPIVRSTLGGTGYSVITGAIVLAIMILPTISNITAVSLQAVHDSFREGSLALGATKWQTITGVVIPKAKTGIIAGIILAIGRALGETMAVLMVAGNTPLLAKRLTDPVRTLTMNIVTDMKYATDEHLTSLFTTAFVLLLFIMGLNYLVHRLTRKIEKNI